MDPILDIRPVQADLYTYSLGTGRQSVWPCDCLFDSMERCLRDAGEALCTYFERVDIVYAGVPLGTHAVARLRNDPLGLFKEMLHRLAADYGRRRTGRPLRAPG